MSLTGLHRELPPKTAAKSLEKKKMRARSLHRPIEEAYEKLEIKVERMALQGSTSDAP